MLSSVLDWTYSHSFIIKSRIIIHKMEVNISRMTWHDQYFWLGLFRNSLHNFNTLTRTMFQLAQLFHENLVARSSHVKHSPSIVVDPMSHGMAFSLLKNQCAELGKVRICQSVFMKGKSEFTGVMVQHTNDMWSWVIVSGEGSWFTRRRKCEQINWFKCSQVLQHSST